MRSCTHAAAADLGQMLARLLGRPMLAFSRVRFSGCLVPGALSKGCVVRRVRKLRISGHRCAACLAAIRCAAL